MTECLERHSFEKKLVLSILKGNESRDNRVIEPLQMLPPSFLLNEIKLQMVICELPNLGDLRSFMDVLMKIRYT